MSKLYTKYLELKRKDPNKIYIIKSGIFYLLIDEDAKYMNQISHLKCTFLTENIIKCGFPESAKNKYISLLKRNKKEVEVVELSKTYSILKELKTIDLNQMTSLEAFRYLEKIQKQL